MSPQDKIWDISSMKRGHELTWLWFLDVLYKHLKQPVNVIWEATLGSEVSYQIFIVQLTAAKCCRHHISNPHHWKCSSLKRTDNSLYLDIQTLCVSLCISACLISCCTCILLQGRSTKIFILIIGLKPQHCFTKFPCSKLHVLQPDFSCPSAGLLQNIQL